MHDLLQSIKERVLYWIEKEGLVFSQITDFQAEVECYEEVCKRKEGDLLSISPSIFSSDLKLYDPKISYPSSLIINPNFGLGPVKIGIKRAKNDF